MLDRLGRTKEALAYCEKARDEDVCPLRIMAPLEKILARIAAETRTPLVDAATLIAARSPEGIPGDDWYLDQVHPTVRGHQLIAQALAAQLPAGGMSPPLGPWPDEKRIAAHAHHLDALGSLYFADGRRRVDWLDQWARRQRLAAEAVPADAAGYARLAFRQLALGDDEAARKALGEALHRDRGMREIIERHAEELKAEGRADRATALLRQLD